MNSTKNTSHQSELTSEIREFRDKAKAFAATNDHETYVVAVFSCKADRDKFLSNIDVDVVGNTIIDGYELAEFIGVSPTVPSVKLAAPFKE